MPFCADDMGLRQATSFLVRGAFVLSDAQSNLYSTVDRGSVDLPRLGDSRSRKHDPGIGLEERDSAAGGQAVHVVVYNGAGDIGSHVSPGAVRVEGVGGGEADSPGDLPVHALGVEAVRVAATVEHLDTRHGERTRSAPSGPDLAVGGPDIHPV